MEPPPPPEGYELMQPGDSITKDCQFLSVISKTWIPVKRHGGKFDPNHNHPMVKPIPKPKG